MARSKPIYQNIAARRFREAIRPAMVGRIKYIEPDLATRCAIELGDWMLDLVMETMRTTELNDRKGEAKKQLLGGIRTYGSASLLQLRSQINVQPWLFAQEYGAHIQGSPYLTIPFAYALRPDGSPKFASANSWRRFGSFIKRDKANDRLFLVYKAANGDLRYLYTLVEEVEVKPKLGLIRNAEKLLPRLMSSWGALWLREMAKSRIIEELF